MIGPILGAAVVTLLPEYFQPLKEWRLLVFGLTVMALIAVRPQGLYTRRMQERLVQGVLALVGRARRRTPETLVSPKVAEPPFHN